MKPSYKRTEVGVVPEDWEYIHIGNIASFASGSGVSVASLRGESSENPVPVYGGNGVAGFIDQALVQVPTVVVGRVGQKCGEVYLTSGPSWITDNALYPRTKHCDFHVPFLALALIGAGLNKVKNRNDLPLITQSILHSVLIAWPINVEEQRGIAEALNDVDGLLGALDRLIAKKHDLKQAAMQQLLTGQTRLPGFHGEWEVKTFGEIFDYLPTATNSRSDLNDAGDTYYIHYGDIHTRFHNHLDFRTTQPPRISRSLCRNAALLKNGDWVMADASEDYDGVGKTIEVQGLEECTKGIAGLHTIVLRERTPTYAPGFKGHLGNLKSLHEQYLRVATGMKVYGVSKTALKDLELPVPGPSEQTAIAEVLGEMDAELAGLERRREKTRALKQGMMQELLTGRTRLA